MYPTPSLTLCSKLQHPSPVYVFSPLYKPSLEPPLTAIQIQDNPLHISLFPPHANTAGAYLEFSFLLNASLDIFDLRARDKNRVDQDLGLLHAVDERLSVWGWETGTGTRFAIVLDVWGREGVEGGRGVGEGELRGVSCSFFLVLLWERGSDGSGHGDGAQER